MKIINLVLNYSTYDLNIEYFLTDCDEVDPMCESPDHKAYLAQRTGHSARNAPLGSKSQA
jgi:hypothetical protein